MYVRIDEVPIEQTPRSRHTHKRLIVCTCDQCGIEYTVKYSSTYLKRLTSGYTFCNRSCSTIARKKGGILYEKTQKNRDNSAWYMRLQATMSERHGVNNPGKMPDHADKVQATMNERYGVDSPLQLPRARQRMLESIHTNDADEKRKQTNVERWGHENVFGSTRIQERIVTTLNERYGVDHSSHIKGINEKRIETCQENHGVKCGLQTPQARENARQTFIERYGAETYWQSTRHKQFCRNPELIQQRHETMKANGTYGKSNIEDQVYELLKLQHPQTRRQELVNGWAIDFYVPEIDTYIQIDGVYWHGLDRPKHVIESSQAPRDKAIFNTIKRDTRQNAWFVEHGLKLLRFTDQQTPEQIIKQIQQLIQL